MYSAEHQVKNIVSNFGKLKSPGKSVPLTTSSLSDMDRHKNTCSVKNLLSGLHSMSYAVDKPHNKNVALDQQVKSNPELTPNHEFSANRHPNTHKSDRRIQTPVMFGIYPPLQNQYSYNPFIPTTNSPTTSTGVRSYNLSVDFPPNSQDTTTMGNGSDLYAQFNQSHPSSDHQGHSPYYRNIKPLSLPLMWPHWGTLSRMTLPNTSNHGSQSMILQKVFQNLNQV